MSREEKLVRVMKEVRQTLLEADGEMRPHTDAELAGIEIINITLESLGLDK